MPAKILVVDDEKSIREILTIVLENQGYNVIPLSDGVEAIERFKTENFDLAIVDINLPSIGGIEVLRRIKQLNSDTEVVMVSGYASLDTAVESVRAGAYDYIIKPFNIQTITDVVKRGIEKTLQAIEARKQITSLQEKNRELGLLYELRDVIGYRLDYNEVMDLIMSSLHTILDYHTSAFLFITEEEQIELSIWTGLESPEIVNQVESNLLDAFNSIYEKHVSRDKLTSHLIHAEYLKSDKIQYPQNIRSFLNIPLVTKDDEKNRLIGIVSICSHNDNAFDQSTSKLFHSVANNIISDTLEKQKRMLTEEKNTLEIMVSSMTDGVIMLDRKKHISLLNISAKRMLGLNMDGTIREKNIIKNVSESRFAKSIISIFDRNANDYQCIETDFEEEIYVDQTKMFLSANVSPIKSDDNKIYGIVAVLRDITRRKEIEEAKTNFISTVSHELRTPLTAIKNAVSIIEMSELIDEKLQRFIPIALRNIDRLEKLVNEILAFSKLEDGKMDMSFSIVDLKALSHDIIYNLGELALQKFIKIDEKIPADLPKAYADPDKLEQVLTNIIDNAIKFTPENGKIIVEAKLSKNGSNNNFSDYIEVSVSDTGIGISPEDQQRIFDRFERATLYNKGVGLGLAIAKKIIDNHNGKIWVESELGSGSKFIFTIPRAT
ncbi:TPA: response regulator [bacterium]|nr:response regulator [bacterium]